MTMFYKRIGDLRNDHDVKQIEIAEYLHVQQSTYSDYEKGKINIPVETLVKIANFYHVSLDYLIGNDQIEPNTGELKPGRYRHFKGNEYRLLCTAQNSETMERMVVYQALYGERGIWVRPAAMWSERVERDGYAGPRFYYIGE